MKESKERRAQLRDASPRTVTTRSSSDSHLALRTSFSWTSLLTDVSRNSKQAERIAEKRRPPR